MLLGTFPQETILSVDGGAALRRGIVMNYDFQRRIVSFHIGQMFLDMSFSVCCLLGHLVPLLYCREKLTIYFMQCSLSVKYQISI